jgi:hypothetical protein
MLPAAGMYVMFSNHLLGEPLANRTNVIPHGQGNLRLLIPYSHSGVGFKAFDPLPTGSVLAT